MILRIQPINPQMATFLLRTRKDRLHKAKQETIKEQLTTLGPLERRGY
jgi:hypothetical protein